MKNLIVALAVLFFNFNLYGNQEIQFQNRENLRCIQLLPELIYPVAVDFAIPDEFVAMSPSGKLDLCDWVYWGKPDVLAQYFKNPESLSEPIIRVQLSGIVPQGALYEKDKFESDSNNFTNCLPSWGTHPVKEAKATHDGLEMYFAWVGLNAPGEETLFFNLQSPNNNFDEKALSLWRTFLEKTKPLPFQQTLLAHGQDIHLGVTIMTCNTGWNTAKIQAICEKRIRDQKVKIAVKLLDENLEFECMELDWGRVGCENWYYGKEMVKIYSCVTEKFGKNSKNVFDQVTTVLVKPVEEFTFSEKDSEFAWGVCEDLNFSDNS